MSRSTGAEAVLVLQRVVLAAAQVGRGGVGAIPAGLVRTELRRGAAADGAWRAGVAKELNSLANPYPAIRLSCPRGAGIRERAGREVHAGWCLCGSASVHTGATWCAGYAGAYQGVAPWGYLRHLKRSANKRRMNTVRSCVGNRDYGSPF